MFANPFFTMKSKNINRLKLTTTIGLLLIVLGSFAYGSLRGDKESVKERFPEKKEAILKDTLVAPTKVVEVTNTLTEPTMSSVSLRDSIVNYGIGLLGTPYVEAGCSRDGFDCSGFVYFVYQHFKIQVPRSSSQFENFGQEIEIANVRKGDILLFLSPTRNVIGHLGIVSNPNGMETDFIHATSGREMKVVISSLKIPGYTRRFVKAIRVL